MQEYLVPEVLAAERDYRCQALRNDADGIGMVGQVAGRCGSSAFASVSWRLLSILVAWLRRRLRANDFQEAHRRRHSVA
jgi:hypothetical protein